MKPEGPRQTLIFEKFPKLPTVLHTWPAPRLIQVAWYESGLTPDEYYVFTIL